ncbi:MAG: hypothetical protein HY959_03905 [Ignavibacteriae bacterium]|nr:hypothetical protein [Ignavibacteriota bacterium]
MKLFTSTIVSSIILFILAFLFYWGVFSAGYMGSYLHIMRPPEDQKILANIVGFITQGFLLSLIYMYYYKGISPFKEGVIYGLLTGFLISFPFIFFMWANYTVRYKAVIAEGLGMGFRILIAGIVIGLIFGRKEQK